MRQARDAPSAIEQSLAAAGLKAARIVPLANGALQLTFANVSYAALVGLARQGRARAWNARGRRHRQGHRDPPAMPTST